MTEFGGGTPLCVAGGHGCETVARSKYSHVAGINVAAIGIAGYVLICSAPPRCAATPAASPG